MTLDAGEPGYGSMAARTALSGSVVDAETAPLLIPEDPQEYDQWQPMTKEELEVAAGSAGWKKLRTRLVVVFWLAWLAMLCTSVAIIVKSPRPIAAPLRWWQKSLFYQLQPVLFVDPQAEEQGGISGVCDHISYFKSLGVGALILEGLFLKGMSPSDIKVINESIGTVPQIQHLLAESNKAGLKVVFDFCELDLFATQESPGNDTEPYSIVQYALRFWLEQGVAGFAICDTDAAYSEKTLLEWRVVIKEFSSQGEERIVLVKQMGDFLPSLGNSSSNDTLVEVVMKTILPPTHHHLSAQEVALAIETRLQMTKDDLWPSWAVGGKASFGLQNLLMVLMMTLPGSPAVQYGEEISHAQNKSLNSGWLHEGEQLVEMQKPHVGKMKSEHSPLALFTSLSNSRAREEALLYGSFTFLPFNTTSLSSSNSTLSSPPLFLAFLRSWGCVHFLVLLNIGPESHALDPAWAHTLPNVGVFVTSTRLNRVGSTSLDTVKLQPREAIVIKLFEAGSYS
ncbi:4F2 cell-surface antigen heavy chain [Lampris incognitus]|uniref:4F2 cell-surface antigen heavy chain n=1 Tax=Lampris incognitus TaxID=2546036 RepID=UPI0024B4F7DD|nr:4F2 cell-surface antigen heavy chain [Lampris incognitus]